MLSMVPRCSGLATLIRTRTVGGIFTAVLEARFRVTVEVPVSDRNALGSTVTVTVAGVVPLEGDTVTLGSDVGIVKGVFPAPGSVRLSVWEAGARSQKLPRKNKSVAEAAKRGEAFRFPTGSTKTPESETEYRTLASLLSTLLPVVFSGSFRRSRIVRLSLARIWSIGASP